MDKLMRLVAGFVAANGDRGLAKNVSRENAARIVNRDTI